ncbi:hypothetical protein AVEN_269660-1, partial [Araneus ventricosus]
IFGLEALLVKSICLWTTDIQLRRSLCVSRWELEPVYTGQFLAAIGHHITPAINEISSPVDILKSRTNARVDLWDNEEWECGFGNVLPLSLLSTLSAYFHVHNVIFSTGNENLWGHMV